MLEMHGKRWTNNDYSILDNTIKNLQEIKDTDIQEIAYTLKRNTDAIKYKILLLYIEKEFDYLTDENNKLYEKYIFLKKEEIDYYIFKKFTKKEKIYYKLMKIYNIINESKFKKKHIVLDLIDEITAEI
tara:strand:- start:878 stop:1264 length:387 start_codon:yes stop_codon:yes gene_type:complete